MSNPLYFHFNNAGDSLSPATVTQTIIEYIQSEAIRGGYELANEKSIQIQKVYESIGQLLHCSPNEITITDSGTRAWNSIVYALELQQGDKVLVAQQEYGSNIASLRHICLKTGAQIVTIDNNNDGQVCIDSLQNKLCEKVKLVAITHVPCNNGLVNPITQIGQIVANTPAFYLVDACQSVGQMPLDTIDIQCDAMVCTGRKWLRGPRGTGFFYLNKSQRKRVPPAQIEHYALQNPAEILSNLTTRNDGKQYELSEKNIALVLGLGAAIDHALEMGLEKIKQQVQQRSYYLRQKLQKISNVTVRDLGESTCGIVTFTVDNFSCAKVKDFLAQHHINIALMPAYLSPLASDYVDILRASPHYYTSYADIDHLCHMLEQLQA